MYRKEKDKPALIQPPGLLPNYMVLVVCLIYLIALYWYAMGDTAFWRDEALPLLIAKGNASFADLIKALGYEGTPGLWHILLWLTDQATP
ncbi:MAG: hypothetical protein JRH15_11975, partial [Deltaproteobacteria bacterium]|nr:hypothetical protein [Deltaproteobacteria bacterium]